MRLLAYFLLAILAAQSIGGANAYCSAPSMYAHPPEAPSSISRPDLPYCMINYPYTRKHECESWEIDQYFSEVNDYIRKLNNFIIEAQTFANEATAFANEAYAYGNCEVQQVKSQTE